MILFSASLHLAAALPDLSAVDKLFREKRYAEALKGYSSCEKNRIGERGYVILRSAICAERLGDAIQRSQALRKLCAMEPTGADAKYVEAAYRMRYEKDAAPSRHTGDLDRFIREASMKFHGGGFAARIATHEVEKQIRSCNWRQALKTYKTYPVQYAAGISNAVEIVRQNVLKGVTVDGQSARAMARVYSFNPSLAEHLAAHTPDGCRAWLFWDRMADECLRGGKWEKALSLYGRAQECEICNRELVQFKIFSIFLTRPDKTDDVIARGETFLQAYPDSRWHYAVCKSLLGAMMSAKRFEEADALVNKSGFWKKPYFTPEINKVLAELGRQRAAEIKKRLAAQNEEGQETLGVALKLRREKKFAEAVAACDRIAASERKDAPKDAARHLAAQICFEDLSDYGAAGERYRKLMLTDGPEAQRKADKLLALRAVSCLIICGKMQVARDMLGSISPDKDDLALMSRMEALLSLARPMRKGAKSVARQVRAADVLFASGEYGVAMREYGKVVSAKGVDRDTVLLSRMQVARCLSRLREHSKARDAYESLIKAAGRCALSADALLRLGTVYAGALNDADSAERCLKKAATEYQGSLTAERALYNLVSLYIMTGKWELATDARLRFLKICKTERVRRIVDIEYGRFIKNKKIGRV